MARPRPNATAPPPDVVDGIGFLLSQVAFHTSARFAERLQPLEFKPEHAGILRVIRQADGLSQQALGEKLGMFASRLVGLIDEMERRGLVERRDSPSDRRSYALYLTPAGRTAVDLLDRMSRELQEEIFASLTDAERVQMAEFLRRIAADQGLKPGVHPALRKMGNCDTK